jgi:hypothetical protein
MHLAEPDVLVMEFDFCTWPRVITEPRPGMCRQQTFIGFRFSDLALVEKMTLSTSREGAFKTTSRGSARKPLRFRPAGKGGPRFRRESRPQVFLLEVSTPPPGAGQRRISRLVTASV